MGWISNKSYELKNGWWLGIISTILITILGIGLGIGWTNHQVLVWSKYHLVVMVVAHAYQLVETCVSNQYCCPGNDNDQPADEPLVSCGCHYNIDLCDGQQKCTF